MEAPGHVPSVPSHKSGTTAGEDETTEVNPGNRNGDTVEVAPPVPAPEDEAAT